MIFQGVFSSEVRCELYRRIKGIEAGRFCEILPGKFFADEETVNAARILTQYGFTNVRNLSGVCVTKSFMN